MPDPYIVKTFPIYWKSLDPQGKDGAPGSKGLPGADGRSVSFYVPLLSKVAIRRDVIEIKVANSSCLFVSICSEF